MERTQKEANTVKPSPRKDKSSEGKQQTSDKKTDEAASETSEMDTTETEMPPLLEASNDDSNDDENGAKRKKFQFKKPTPKPNVDHNFKEKELFNLSKYCYLLQTLEMYL